MGGEDGGADVGEGGGGACGFGGGGAVVGKGGNWEEVGDVWEIAKVC